LKLEVQDLTVRIRGETIIENASLTLQGPGLVQILGPNGAGKTTLLRAILGLVRPVTGRVLVNGVDVTGDPARAGRHMAYTPQRPPLTPWNPMTAWELVYTRLLLEGPWPRLGRGPKGKARAALEAAGVPREAWWKRLHELSGGTLMRVFIARALALERRILLMDEPLAPVDPRGRVELARLLARLSRGRLVVVTSHDPELLLEHTVTIVLVNRGIVAAGPPEEVLQEHVLARVYGGSVLMRGHPHIVDSH